MCTMRSVRLIHAITAKHQKLWNSDPSLHRRLERPRPPLRLDQNRRKDPQKGRPPNNLRSTPLGSSVAAREPLDIAVRILYASQDEQQVRQAIEVA